MRIAIVDGEKCKPSLCSHECKKSCPVVKMGKKCIEVHSGSGIAFLSEVLCNGCGICVKKCPFGAVAIVNLPVEIDGHAIHRYGVNQFQLHQLPFPQRNSVLGLVGINGIGKSTALKIMAGKLKPNLGDFDNAPDWEDIVQNYKGTVLQNYFKRIVENELKTIIKPQYVDLIPKSVSGIVGEILEKKNQRGNLEQVIEELQLGDLLERGVHELSGGELQRFAIATVVISESDVYMFDEPSSYLDIKQRVLACRTIRSLTSSDKDREVIVVEHDLSVLDHMSDYVCVLYGVPGAFGIITAPYSVRRGINIFLSGYSPAENVRFRNEELNFKLVDSSFHEDRDDFYCEYPDMSKTYDGFHLNVLPGSFSSSEIIVLLGENGTGKTTFIKMLAGIVKPDDENAESFRLSVSYKPQILSPKFKGTVRQLLISKLGYSWESPQFKSDVTKPLAIERFIDQPLRELSGGEIQRVALVLCLGKPADIYLIDEPSAYLDSEQRIVASKVIKRFIYRTKKTAFLVEHDFIMATYLADRVIVFEGTPSVSSTAESPVHFVQGVNTFLRQLDISIRRDPITYLPKINKYGSKRDREQKAEGNYFVVEEL